MSLSQALGSVALQSSIGGSVAWLLLGGLVGAGAVWWFLKQSGSKGSD